MMPLRRPRHLARELYVGYHRIFLTMCTFQRRKVFATAEAVDIVRSQLLRHAHFEGIEIVAYCFMPDHLHALTSGNSEFADAHRFLTRFRQRSGFHYREQARGRLWQDGYFDQHLRDGDATFDVAKYIVGNPVRTGLCDAVDQYPHSGSSRYAMSELVDSVQWRPTPLG